jgi:hypothetical protein
MQTVFSLSLAVMAMVLPQVPWFDVASQDGKIDDHKHTDEATSTNR